ncbi:MAG TPA: cytochrome P450 [Thermoanaerobaculia bacterium]|jgi:unspecific monooxygenase|nr:cytochrome P450 [Thermoanaerobaculia bacterium]
MKPASEIPRPAGSLLTHSLRFARNTMQFYEDVYRECGDIFATRIPGLGNWVYICSPELVKAMLEAPPGVLAGGSAEGFSLAHVLGYGATSYLDGPTHQERRAVTAPYFDARHSQGHVDEVREITQRRLAEWPSGRPFQLVLALQKIALEALIKVFFTAAGPERVRQLADLYEDFSFKGVRSPSVPHTSLQIDLGPWSPWGRVKKRQREVFRVFQQEIAARLASVDRPEEDDPVLGLGRARLGDAGDRCPLSRDAILAEILDFLFQGHEMVGDSLTWTLGELLTHPQVLARLRQELASVVGDESLQASDLPNLPYLEAVVWEGLRRRPTNLFTTLRHVKQPFPLDGYLLPEGTWLAVCYPALSVREDLFANPKDFDPDGNFYGKTIPAEAWSPFGGGAHACAGKELALVMMRTALATIVRKTELKLAQDVIRPVRNAYYYEPNKGLLVTLEKRL